MKKLFIWILLAGSIGAQAQNTSSNEITKKDAFDFIKKYASAWCKLDPSNFASENLASNASNLKIPSAGALYSTKYYDTKYGVWAMDKCSFEYSNYWGYTDLFSFFKNKASVDISVNESSSGDKLTFGGYGASYKEVMTEYITYPSGAKEEKYDSWQIRFKVSGSIEIEFKKIDSFFITTNSSGNIYVQFKCLDQISKMPFQMKFSDFPGYGCNNSITDICKNANSILSNLFSNPLYVLCKVDTKENAERLVKALNFIVNENKKYRQTDKF
jgi:hypothetical protein